MSKKHRHQGPQHHATQDSTVASTEGRGESRTPYAVRIEPSPKDEERYREEKDSHKKQLDKAQTLNTISAIGVGIALLALIGLAINACISHRQLKAMQETVEISRKAMQIDQRPWLYPDVPNYFSFTGPTIPAKLKLSNVGKTVATNITGKVVATTFNKGENPSFDEYGIGHPHMNIYGAALYPPESPIEIPLVISRYGEKEGEQATTISPNKEFVDRFNRGELFIILFGKVDYCDVFGVKHWVRFCNGSGGALSSDGIKQCLNYNRADNNDFPDPGCRNPN